MNVASLFANIGVAEAYLDEMGFDVVLANELIPRRADLYSKIYPETNVICGDISKKSVLQKLIDASKKLKVDIVIATPPCQGMSTAGQQKKDDHRNNLIVPTLSFIKSTDPKYVFIENVPQFLNTSIIHNGSEIGIVDLIKKELSSKYHIEVNVVDAKHYSVPQTRERAILLLSKKTNKKLWTLPSKHKYLVTLKDVIGKLPSIDPFIKDVSEAEMRKVFPDFETKKAAALKISKWNNPPRHVKRQIVAMSYTPTGKSAFSNKLFKPKKDNGDLIKGFPNTYKRQNWDTPGYAITMDNVKISSQDNVHPGRPMGKDAKGREVYSDPRVLTLYELMRVMSLPEDWPIPENTSEAFLRRIIGEGIPPLLVKNIFEQLKN
jgi:DNA (cytosine-5)-methyltransferase 1